MESLPDFRSERKKKHVLAEVVMCLILGFMAGKTTMRRAIAWCERNIDGLREYMPLENGIASPSTACRVLCGLDEEVFLLEFMAWIGEIISPEGKHIAIDGKALRAAASKVSDNGRPMIMNAMETVTGLVLAQLPLCDKENEITTIPKLLELLDISGSTVTIDAVGTQTSIMDLIREHEGHFVFTVKKNQPEAYEDLTGLFETMASDYEKMKKDPGYRPEYPEAMEKYDECRTVEKNRERVEYRTTGICGDCEYLKKTMDKWPHVETIGFSRHIRIPVRKDGEGNDITPSLGEFLDKGQGNSGKGLETGDGMDASVQMVGMISSRVLNAEEMAQFKRDHWAVENRLHHVLDDTFREDRSPARKSKNNMAVLRKIVYNILRLAIMAEQEVKTMPEMMDIFSDDIALMGKFAFSGIKSFY